MPFYEYECSSCKFYTELMQKISDPPLKKCPSCGQRTMKKLVSAPVFRLKGGGWYETDFKSDKDARRNLAVDKPAEAAPADAPKAEAVKAEASPTDAAKPAAEAKPSEAKASDTKAAGASRRKSVAVSRRPAKPVASRRRPTRKARR
ncbi:MAG TPA: zinc ribbon domain-containing protein [Steroidobacteraceae bacterium]|nr:zinc ribbon domain-containing protein [Steroidobacteraceae bacterium]